MCTHFLPAPAAVGALAGAVLHALMQVFDQLSLINLLGDNATMLSTSYPAVAAIQPSQPTPAVHQCANLHRGWWYWQRLRVPASRALFTPSTNPSLSPFPPESYRSVPAANTSTPFFRGFAATLAKPALRSIDESRSMLLGSLNGPPGESDLPGLSRAMRQVLQQSATLDDRKKVIAECECGCVGLEGPRPASCFTGCEQASNTVTRLRAVSDYERLFWCYQRRPVTYDHRTVCAARAVLRRQCANHFCQAGTRHG